MSLVSHVRYFYGRPGHEHAVFQNGKVVSLAGRSWSELASMILSSDAVFSKSPKGGWCSEFVLKSTGNIGRVGYNNQYTKISKKLIDQTLAAIAEDAAEVERRKDPAYLLEVKLKGHDWTYAYSDDYRYWSAGNANWSEIQRLLKLVPKRVGNRLLKKYTPK